MRAIFQQWLHGFLPQPLPSSKPERIRATIGACVGLFVTALLTHVLAPEQASWLIAPMGASAVLLFCVPASPLAQPWPVAGGNTVSALIGVACAALVPDTLLAAPLAGCLAIAAMFALRCLHPPGGAVALTTVLGGHAVHEAGWMFALNPVALNSTLIVLAAILYNNLTGRRYPHAQHAADRNLHGTGDPAPNARLGITEHDLVAALGRYGEVLDVSRDDLLAIVDDARQLALQRRFKERICGELMSTRIVFVSPRDTVEHARELLLRYRLQSLPVLDEVRHLRGVLAQEDVLRQLGWGARLRQLVPGAALRVQDAMQQRVVALEVDDPLAQLVPLLTDKGYHQVAIVDKEGAMVGLVSQSDLLAALSEERLETAA
ncbi:MULTISPECIES: HPP family protein [unclassified Massilia]|uniref:HPP family protein n=1 Tax=unclassified Massilia TaxID=2609279 RepID=UPI0017817410|nr:MULTISPECIES: HPP family protein [unclassified Massilia]MBD8532823.1 HPP family protein [Massilia sp. CFBP 13647]MBD8676184.1 HPP family protein [Massilia sp. CFBP 13721]